MKTTIEETVELLKAIIAIPSFSTEESQVSEYLHQYLSSKELTVHSMGQNLWVRNQQFDPSKPTLLLNSHIDTVRPNSGWKRDPFHAYEEEGKIFGLGSNDAGGCLVSLIHTLLYFYDKDLNINLLLTCTAEEEISGMGGISLILDAVGKTDFGIVGEPTQMEVAIAEKGLLVVDGIARGQSGHAARSEGINAISIALRDISWLHRQPLTKVSPWLGPSKITVTQIEAGSQHNVIPATCNFVIDIRLNEHYDNQEVIELLTTNLKSEVSPRSLRLKSSGIDEKHILVQTAKELGLKLYGSPTLSDQALIPFPTIKMGCGSSARSHTAEEFIYRKEIEQGIMGYIQYIEKLNKLIAI